MPSDIVAAEKGSTDVCGREDGWWDDEEDKIHRREKDSNENVEEIPRHKQHTQRERAIRLWQRTQAPEQSLFNPALLLFSSPSSLVTIHGHLIEHTNPSMYAP